MFNKRVETLVPVYSNWGPLILAMNKLSGKNVLFPVNFIFKIPIKKLCFFQ